MTLVLLAAYACAAWLRQPALVIFCAAPLLWQLPCEQRWFGDRRRARAAARGASADLALLGTTWAIATWALWQHRLLPLLVCTAVVLLLLAERSTRRLAFPKRAGIL